MLIGEGIVKSICNTEIYPNAPKQSKASGLLFNGYKIETHIYQSAGVFQETIVFRKGINLKMKTWVFSERNIKILRHTGIFEQLHNPEVVVLIQTEFTFIFWQTNLCKVTTIQLTIVTSVIPGENIYQWSLVSDIGHIT